LEAHDDLSDLRQLQPLVAYPRESLEIELKGWLDLSIAADAAVLIKAVLALANHGGGYILIGFHETGGAWQPDEANRPTDLSQFDQDVLNGLVARYSEPPFHCELHHVPHSETGDLFPVIVVPPGRVPIRAKRDSPDARQVRKDSYYIRRPGPASETPQTGQEWDDFLRRCVTNDRERLLDDIRRILGARALAPVPPLPTWTEQLDEWAHESLARWRERVAEANEDDLYRHGVVTYSYILEGDFDPLPPPRFLEVVERAKGRETGWPMWLVFRGRDTMSPRPVDGTIEAIFLDNTFGDPSHADFWRAHPEGRMFLLRGYEEDSDPERRPPGTAFDFTLPVWRFGEALLHSERLAQELGDPTAIVHFRASWSGLRGRALTALWSRRFVSENRIAQQESIASYVHVPAADITPRLPELLQELLAPLYTVFDFFEMPPRVVDEELAEMRSGRH
jgi:hypothetical protein